MRMVPLLDPKAQYATIRAEIREAIDPGVRGAKLHPRAWKSEALSRRLRIFAASRMPSECLREPLPYRSH